MPYIKRVTQKHMSFTNLLTLQELSDLLECVAYLGKTPGETGG